MDYYKCLYTKHLVKKRKTWEDGFLVVKGGVATIHDADGRQLQEGVRVPSSALDSSSDDGPSKCFSGLLVTVEEKCDTNNLPVALSDAEKHPGATSGSLNASKIESALPEQGLVPVQRSAIPVLGRRSSQHFMPPKPLSAKPADQTTNVARFCGPRLSEHVHKQPHKLDSAAHRDGLERPVDQSTRTDAWLRDAHGRRDDLPPLPQERQHHPSQPNALGNGNSHLDVLLLPRPYMSHGPVPAGGSARHNNLAGRTGKASQCVRDNLEIPTGSLTRNPPRVQISMPLSAHI